MCGICGVVSKDHAPGFDAVRRMSDALRMRGPDGSGELELPHISMAMRRLSIIDLEGGWQPLYNEDGKIALVANGEIYNFVELRQMLEKKGHRFRTRSDCETIVHLYEDYGTDCVSHLRGMFAFALWDDSKKRLLLARDRMGEKPLYIYETEGCLVFASEMKAILSSCMVPFELNPAAVNLYFHFQYVPEPYTPLKGVRKLPPAHVLTIDAGTWAISERRYWDMRDAPPIDSDPVSTIRKVLEEVSDIVVRSDVPVGVSLSGGLDSSAVAALASRKYPGTIHAFSIGYAGRPPCDERRDAEEFARHLGIPFHDVELDTGDMISFFPELVYLRDDPIADVSGYGYYSVMKLAHSKGVPVILQGQGGDELFWGYPWVKQAVDATQRKNAISEHYYYSLARYLRPQMPEQLSIRGALGYIRSLAGLRPGLQQMSQIRKSPQGQLIFYDLSADYNCAASEKDHMYGRSIDTLAGKPAPQEIFTVTGRGSATDVEITERICSTYLLENGITQGDRLSMASSVEMRLPLLDFRLVETVIGLRKRHADYQLEPKAWLKGALKGVVPEWVINRPKRGFSPPTGEWHRATFQAYGRDLIDGYLVRTQILKPEIAERFSTGCRMPGENTPLSYKALILEEWCRKMSAIRGGHSNA